MVRGVQTTVGGVLRMVVRGVQTTVGMLGVKVGGQTMLGCVPQMTVGGFQMVSWVQMTVGRVQVTVRDVQTKVGGVQMVVRGVQTAVRGVQTTV